MQKKDKLLGKIILAIVVIPLALLVIFMLGLTFMRTSNGYGITSSTVSIEDAAQVDKVGRWMYQCRSDAQTAFDATQEVTQTYALRYRTGETGVNYLFYLPYVDCDSNSCETEIVPSFRGDVLAVKASGASNSDGMLYAVNIEGTQPGQVRVKLDGKKTTCNIQDVDYDPCAFAIVDEEDDDDRWLAAAATEQQGATDPQIKRWLAQCRREKLSDKQIKVYALRYRGEDLTGYLFYFRNLANPKDGEDSPDIEEVLDGDLTVTANGDADSKTGGILYAVRILDGSVPDQVKVELNGKTVQCDVQEAKFDPCQPIFDLEDDGFDAEDADADDVDTDEADKGADNADTAAKSA